MAILSAILFLTFVGLFTVEGKIQFSIKEGLSANNVVGNIGNSSGLRKNYTGDDYESIKYRFLDNTVMNTRFFINADNGNLYTSIVLDRELICGHQEECIMKFDVAAFSNVIPIFKILSLEVSIEDVNDNVPTFPTSSVTFKISESAAVGSTLPLVEAQDEDSTSLNSIKSYEIVPKGFGIFKLNATAKQDGGFFLKLVLQQNLDREENDSYQIQVVAKDGGAKQNSGTLVVNIVVTDYNDHSPVFAKSTYNVTVNEGIATGTSIIRVVATDKDSGDNAKITYGFSSRQPDMSTISSLFSVDSVTGELTVKGNLVYQENKVYELLIEAKDHGEQPRVSQATVFVSVRDVGNNAPVVTVNFLSSGLKGRVNISEAANQETVIAHVNVVDTDSGLNGKVKCSISNTVFGLHVVTGKGYIVVVNGTLDRETRDSYNITITCVDQGPLPLRTSVSFLVQITDDNDNAPIFKENNYLAFVAENSRVGAVIRQVNASDKDLQRNSKVYYYLDKDSKGMFAINSESGVITTHAVFDREKQDTYIFTVLAVDSGNPPMTGSATIKLTITDKNDNIPSFEADSFQFFVEENQASGTYVGTLSANDADAGENGLVTFSIAPEYYNNVPFYILPNSEMRTSIELNREQKSEYRFEIVAMDKGSPAHSSSAMVIVRVSDSNDQTPVIAFPNNKNSTVSVSFLAPVGHTITTIKAYDLDEDGPNSRLSYFILSGNTEDIFSVGKTSGNVYLKRTHPVQMDETFTITILVRDNGKNPREATHDLNIILRYSNESIVTPMPEHSNTNIIIAVVVVCLTVVISIVIIATIIILRHHDRHLKMRDTEDKNKTYTKPAIIGNEVLPGEKQNGYLTDVQIVESPKKKKKEVSFSFDEAYDSMSPDFSSSAGSNNVFKENDGQMYSKPGGKLLHLHQLHLQSKEQTNGLNQPSFDDMSESSGETPNSDSGKGGSDVDLSCQINNPEELTNFNYFGQKKKSSMPKSTSSPRQPPDNRPRVHHSRHSNRYKPADVFHTETDMMNKTIGKNVAGSQQYLQTDLSDKRDKSKSQAIERGDKWFPSYV